ncbi:serine hydrolase [Nocardiopsis sp. LOL_012]|uniref:serine hydrolase n=1 Tax=Nocardiopsis sp. LOL_012 TaxID=3345409 RepID=UPI003A8BE7FE
MAAATVLALLPGAMAGAQAVRLPDPESVPARVRLSAGAEVPPALLFAPDPGPSGSATLTVREREDLTGRVAGLAEEHRARVGIAVQDLRTGTAFSYAAHEGFTTASTVKLTILTMLLLRAEEEGRALTSAERAQAEEMIRYSDNGKADSLYARLGYAAGFEEGAERIGYLETVPLPTGRWGATETTAADQLRLLRFLYTDEGPLSEESRAYVCELMEAVAPEQAWGISVAAERDDTVGLKNGWVPRDANDGLWNVNSVGYVAGEDREYLIAVLTDDHPDYFSGVELTEKLVSMVIEEIEAPSGAPVEVPYPAY